MQVGSNGTQGNVAISVRRKEGSRAGKLLAFAFRPLSDISMARATFSAFKSVKFSKPPFLPAMQISPSFHHALAALICV